MRPRNVVATVTTLIILATTTPALAAKNDAWKRVRVTSSGGDATGCRSRGNLHAEIDTFWGGGTEKLYNQLRKKADKLGADLVVVLGSVTSVKLQNGTRLMADGEAFQCAGGDKPASDASKAVPAETSMDPLVSELIQVERALFEAGRNGDREAIAKILDESYFDVEDGKKTTRAEFLAAIQPNPLVKSINYTNCIAAQAGSEASLACDFETTVEQKGRTGTIRGRLSDKFLKDETGWIFKSSEVNFSR